MSTRLINEEDELEELDMRRVNATDQLLLLLRHYHPKADVPGFYDVDLRPKQRFPLKRGKP